MNSWWKLGLITALFLFGIGSGWYAHTVWDGYKEDKVAKQQVAKSEQAETNIIKFNQSLFNANQTIKDPCVNRNMPSKYLKLR